MPREDALRWMRYIRQTWALLEQDFEDGKLESVRAAVPDLLVRPDQVMYFEDAIANQKSPFGDFVRTVARETVNST